MSLRTLIKVSMWDWILIPEDVRAASWDWSFLAGMSVRLNPGYMLLHPLSCCRTLSLIFLPLIPKAPLCIAAEVAIWFSCTLKRPATGGACLKHSNFQRRGSSSLNSGKNCVQNNFSDSSGPNRNVAHRTPYLSYVEIALECFGGKYFWLLRSILCHVKLSTGNMSLSLVTTFHRIRCTRE